MTTGLPRQAADPATPLETLAELAHRHPELRAIIAANPSTYPDLLEWLGTLGDPEVDAALRARLGAATDRDRAADPATDPALLAELAYRHPELRAVIAANPSAYEALREWIAQAGSTAAPAPGSSEAASIGVTAVVAPGPSRLARLNARFGPTFTLDSLVLLAAVAIAAIVSLIAGGIVVSGVSDVVSRSTRGLMSLAGDGQGSVPGSVPTEAEGAQTGPQGQAGTPGGSSQQAVQPAPEPHYVPTVLILDASGSMVRSISSGGTRMAAARSAAITFVEGLGDNALMGLTVFGTGTGNSDAEQAAGCFDVKRVIPVGAVDKARFTSAIGKITESGYTPLGPSMRDAAEQLSGFEVGQIVLVTDGVDTCSPPACEIAAQIHASQPGLTIHTIGFAVDADERAQEQLSCIASAGGGEAVDASSAEQLAARLRAISDPVSIAGSVTANGFNDLRLGMSLEQARGVDPTITLGKVVVDIQYADCDDATLLFKAGRLYGIQPKKAAPTAEGVKVGDDLAKAIGLYGAPVQATDAEGSYAQFPATRGSDSGYRVYYQPGSPGALTGKIVRIVLCICGPGGGTVSEMTNWQIGFDGIGPIKLGMSSSEVFGIVPDPGQAAVLASSPGCTVSTLAPGGIGSRIMLVATSQGSREEVQVLSVTGSSGFSAGRLPRTALGVGIGSTVQEVVAAYPEVTLVRARQGNYLITTDAEGVSLIFVDDGEAVVSIEVNRRPTPLYEPCN